MLELCSVCREDRYDSVRICLGEELLERLANLKLFMVCSALLAGGGAGLEKGGGADHVMDPLLQVGCGAIGCEMLKNYAMMGVGRKPNGRVRTSPPDQRTLSHSSSLTCAHTHTCTYTHTNIHAHIRTHKHSYR